MTSSTTSPTTTDTSSRRLPLPVVAATLREHFGLFAVTQDELGGEIDQNLRVRTDAGQTFFVRVTRAEPDLTELAWQNQLLDHVAATVPDLPLPRLIRTSTGAAQVPVRDDGESFVLRVMSWLPGRTLAEVTDAPAALLRELGVAAGRLSAGLSSLAPPVGLAVHDWDMRRADEVIEGSLALVEDGDDVRDVRRILSWYRQVEPTLSTLPQSVVHQDLNDANVLADEGPDGMLHISGIVDVGDALHSARVTEVAIAAGYAMVRRSDPLAAAAEVVAGFHSALPLTSAEIAAVYPLAAARLCMNAVTWNGRVARSGSEYGRSRSRHTWPTIRSLAQHPPVLAEAVFRAACGAPDGSAGDLDDLARAVAGTFPGARSLDARPASDLYDEVDWHDHDALRAVVAAELHGRVGVLAHLQASLAWAGQRGVGSREPATVRLGSTVLLPAATPLRSPAAAVVAATAGAGRPLVLRHVHGQLDRFSCWWNVSSDLEVGDELAAGDALGAVGGGDVEPGFGPGVQVQLFGDAAVALWPAPRRIRPSMRETWRQLTVDPLPGTAATTDPGLAVADVLAIRSRHIARSQRNYYARPMNLVRGRDVWFYDEDGQAYLDSLNNVTHVGHAEPRVTAAATRQMRKLNTNSRFVYPSIASYTRKLLATLPDPLEVVFLVCSGSEANDLALRIARQVTGREHVVNIDGAYHGNTGVVTGISPNRYKGPGGHGAPPTTHEVRIPDRYRGPYGYTDPDAGSRYAADAAAVMDRIDSDGRRPAAFIAESLMGSAGNIVFPDGYLAGAFAAARSTGALCISDEVQVGVGRLGPWWGFELQDVVPDIVTMGKPLGNGHPLAAVVTTRAIADAFDTGMKYFNTFGGNPVSCAVGEAVLDVVEQDGLRSRAVEVGDYFAASLRELQERQPLIGDVRAAGLYLGVELVRDRATREPARDEAFAVTELTKERGVVVFPNGVHDNVLKIKPPMTFRREHVDQYVETLDEVLSMPELSVRPERGIR